MAFILNNNIAANTNITFTILKIQNPQRPETVRGFNMKTIYTESEPTGYVEVGTDLIKNQSYEARITYPVI